MVPKTKLFLELISSEEKLKFSNLNKFLMKIMNFDTIICLGFGASRGGPEMFLDELIFFFNPPAKE